MLYVLDEPSIGLHQRDNERLLVTLRRLRDLGNTVLVVEHDEEAIRAADHLIDMGPAAGIDGGRVVAEGAPAEVSANPKSLTGDYLAGRRRIDVQAMHSQMQKDRVVRVVNARGNNLKSISAGFPLGTFTCVTVRAGRGRSPGRRRGERDDKAASAPADGLGRGAGGARRASTGLELLDKIIDIDQSADRPDAAQPIPPPTTDLASHRSADWFAAACSESRARGYKPGPVQLQREGAGAAKSARGTGLIQD